MVGIACPTVLLPNTHLPLVIFRVWYERARRESSKGRQTIREPHGGSPPPRTPLRRVHGAGSAPSCGGGAGAGDAATSARGRPPGTPGGSTAPEPAGSHPTGRSGRGRSWRGRAGAWTPGPRGRDGGRCAGCREVGTGRDRSERGAVRRHRSGPRAEGRAGAHGDDGRRGPTDAVAEGRRGPGTAPARPPIREAVAPRVRLRPPSHPAATRGALDRGMPPPTPLARSAASRP